MKAKTWKRVSSRIVYENKWLKVREDKVVRPDGKLGIYGVVEREPVNFIIAMNDKQEIYFVEQYRYPVEKTTLELPAGATMKGKSDLQSAKQELLEETGITAKKWEILGKFYIGPGHENVIANAFLATGLTDKKTTTKGQCGDEAIAKIKKYSLKEVKKLIVQDKIKCGLTLAALHIFFQKRGL